MVRRVPFVAANGTPIDAGVRAKNPNTEAGMGLRRLAGTALVAVAVAAAPAAAQTVTFATSGTFSVAGGGTATCSATTCNFDGFVLSYLPVGVTSYMAPTFADLGDFTTQCNSCLAGAQSIGTGATFTLTITQSNPTAGTGSFVGTIGGALSFNPSSSSLIWTPTQFNLPIGFTNYALVTDAGAGLSGNIVVVAPTPDHNPNPTSISAFVTTTAPEPASMALMATGLLGLIPVVRRRRNN